jgi:DNA-binding FadR family transcriptional regulator
VHVRRGSHGGTFVADGEVLNRISLRRISREPANAMRVLEFLCSNERAALDLALVRLGPPDLIRLRQAIAMMRLADAAPELKQAETLFHLALADASRNTLFSKAIADAWAEMFMPLSGAGSGAHAGLLEPHEALLAAIEGTAPDKARAVLGVIHERWWTLVRQLLRSAA